MHLLPLPLEIAPSKMPNYIQLGQVAINAKNITKAIYYFEKAVEESPHNAQTLACLGQSLCWDNQFHKGLSFLKKAGKQLLKIARKTKDTKQLLSLAEQLQFWNDYPASLELIKQVVQINKKDTRAFQILAHTYSRLNDNKMAILASKQALKKNPNSPVLNIQHATLEAKSGDFDHAIKRLQDILDQPITNEESFRAHKELAILLDKTKQYKQVFNHLYSASELSETLPEVKKQDITHISNMLSSYTSGFNQDFINQNCKHNYNDQTPDPVFLIGFLRSGTTLTQEILGTHDNVFISDETNLVHSLRDKIESMPNNHRSISEQLSLATPKELQGLREFYWKSANDRYGSSINDKLFIDKTTMNTFSLGIINCIFPNAKIIFVMRDPRDVCLSCFMQIMAPSSITAHLFDWEKTIDLYTQSMSWWIHIKEIMSLKYIEFKYEDAITDFEPTFKKVFDFLDLDWTTEAHNFHKRATKKFIASPSFNQVSQPLYSSSVARWKQYETEFSPVIDKLHPFITAFNYDK